MASGAAQKAAIDKAVKKARAQMLSYGNEQATAVQRLLRLIANAIRLELLSLQDGGRDVLPGQIPSLRAFLSGQGDELLQQYRAIVYRALPEAARLGAASVLPLTGSGLSVDAVVTQTMAWLTSFRAADGLQLSDRLWRVASTAQTELRTVVETGILRGQSSYQAALEYIAQGKSVPTELGMGMKAREAANLAAKAEALLVNPKGDVLYAAHRVVRTEMNRAYVESNVASLAQHPDVIGIRYLLSPLHPKTDVCLRAGSLIATTRGPVPIEQIALGDHVLTHRGRYRPVTRLYVNQTPAGSMIRLCSPAASSRSPALVMTPNHPVLTPQGWMPAGDLQTACSVAVAPGWRHAPARMPGSCVAGKASRCSGQSEPVAAGGIGFAERYGADRSLSRRIARTPGSRVQAPTPAPRFGAGTSRWSSFHQTIVDCLRRCVLPTFSAETTLAVGTCWDDACRSSGSLRLYKERRPASSISRVASSSMKRTIFHMWRTSTAWLHGTPDSNPSSKTCAASTSASTAERDAVHRSRRISFRFSDVLSYINHSMRRFSASEATRIDTCGETVFNIEVDEDHSYVANGFVVHNCDMYAAANLYGLGPGVYPPSELPYPAHPNTLCTIEAVFNDEVSEDDRAGKQSMFDWLADQSTEMQAGVLGGKQKAAAFAAGQLHETELLSPWSQISARLGVPA